MPVVGFLRSTSAAPFANLVTAFRKGLNEAGYVEDQNVAVEYRWAEGRHDRLPALVADLIRGKMDVFVGNNLAALAAKAATTTVPIVFASGSDPVMDGLVASLNRPGGNVTGVSFTSGVLGPKRLELLRQLVPGAKTIAMLANQSTAETVTERSDVQAAALAIGQQLVVLDASSDQDIEAAFATFIQRGAGALLVGTGAFWNSHRVRIVALATRQALPVVYPLREYVEDGGLMSYGTSINDAYRQAGVYAGRILKGEKPARPAGHAVHQIRASAQPQDRQDARARHPANATRARRRGDRVTEWMAPLRHLGAKVLAARNRREFIALLGGAAAAWPLAARAQQPAMPVVGMLNPATAEGYAQVLRKFREGLKEVGYVEGENVVLEYRWADNDVSRLPELAADLVRRRVALIAATGGPASALAAKAATSTIPILFTLGGDPVRLGLVASLGRPGGNLTGANFFIFELGAKRLEALRELVPGMTRLAVLVDPSNAEITAGNLKAVEPAARAMGLQMRVLEARNNREIDAAFATFARERPDALFVSSGPLFTSRPVQLVLLATRHGVPAAYPDPEHVHAGGLMSYGASRAEAYRQVGIYAGRILKGASPADLPVMQSTKFELCINLQAARVLGLEVPPTLLARADEVIE